MRSSCRASRIALTRECRHSEGFAYRGGRHDSEWEIVASLRHGVKIAWGVSEGVNMIFTQNTDIPVAREKRKEKKKRQRPDSVDDIKLGRRWGLDPSVSSYMLIY